MGRAGVSATEEFPWPCRSAQRPKERRAHFDGPRLKDPRRRAPAPTAPTTLGGRGTTRSRGRERRPTRRAAAARPRATRGDRPAAPRAAEPGRERGVAFGRHLGDQGVGANCYTNAPPDTLDGG
eukprot:scaffold9255_cov140-Isochrysis_galbana.AAC.1